jgi:hypothetical protein
LKVLPYIKAGKYASLDRAKTLRQVGWLGFKGGFFSIRKQQTNTKKHNDHMINETKTQSLLRNAKQALDLYRQEENEARKALFMASESTRKAKEKYESLFQKEQDEAVAKLRAEYNHCTA